MSVLRCLIIGMLIFSTAAVYADRNEAWLYGKWELTYDPDGAAKDWLEFMPGGDAFSSGPLGRLEGIYIVDGDDVKAVFTYQGKDFIMNFRANRQAGQLEIITSHTGRASIYTRMDGKDQ